MSGHNRWTQIKRKKEKTDGQKSKIFSKFARLITQEAKIGGSDSPSLKRAIDQAKSANMPNDNIDRAIKKALDPQSKKLESIFYEAYGPGGVAIVVEAMTDNKNKAVMEVKTALTKNGSSLANPGSAMWAFEKNSEGELLPTIETEINEIDFEKLEKIIEALEECEEVQNVITNAK